MPCSNTGLWPVLVDNEQTMLASPIILYDYPRIAPESPGLQFDSGEIDQLLILNTLTLTDAEKAEVRATDPRAREILDRAESLSAADLGRPHPRARADVFDLILNNRFARIESIEQDFEDDIHVAVTLPDDPGHDLGLQRMPSHRFFFSLDEIEPITS